MTGNGAVGASYGDMLVTSLLVLGAVCVAAFVAVRLFGRVLATGRARGTHLMDVVARVPLEPRRSLYVVEVAGKTLLVGTSEMGLSVLSELDAAEVKSRVVPRQSFADLVRGAWQNRKGLARSRDASATSPEGEAAAHVGAPGAATATTSSPTATAPTAASTSAGSPSTGSSTAGPPTGASPTGASPTGASTTVSESAGHDSASGAG